MSKKKKKQSTTMEDHLSLHYRNGEVKEDSFHGIEYEISSILLELSHPVVFSSDSPFLRKWGRTKKRSASVFLHPPGISPEPVMKSMLSVEVGEMGSTSSSSCLTGEAKKTNPQSINRGLEEEYSTNNHLSSQANASCSNLEAETGLTREQVGLVAQPIAAKETDDHNLRHLQPLICVDRTANVSDTGTASLLRQAMDNLERRGFDLNIPAAEESNRKATTVVGFQRVATRVQAAAQARQRRLGLIRSKKLFTRFFSPYQHFSRDG